MQSRAWVDFHVPLLGAGVPPSGGILDAEWLTTSPVERVVTHWTAGGYAPAMADLSHYHFLIAPMQPGEPTSRSVRIFKGKFGIRDNDPARHNGGRLVSGRYAAHTKGLNSNSVGVAVCCMRGAVYGEGKTDGNAPLTPLLWEALQWVTAELAHFYNLPHPLPYNACLTHGEVEQRLHIKQNGKWDVTRLPWDRRLSKDEVCSQFRVGVNSLVPKFPKPIGRK